MSKIEQSVIENFLESLISEKGLSKNTIESYKSDIKQFLEKQTISKASQQIISRKSVEKSKNIPKNFKSFANDITLFSTNKSKGTFANKIIDQYKNSKKLFIITFVPNRIYCLAGYWIEVSNPGKFESIFYKKSKQKINEYKNIKKEVDEFIKDINLEYKSIKKEINNFLR